MQTRFSFSLSLLPAGGAVAIVCLAASAAIAGPITDFQPQALRGAAIVPEGSPASSAVVLASPAPLPNQAPAANTAPQASAPPAAPLDARLVGRWQPDASAPADLRKIVWDQAMDGRYILTGGVEDNGTIAATEGKIQQKSAQMISPIQFAAYDLRGDSLVTNTSVGQITWHRFTGDGDQGNGPKSAPRRERKTVARPVRSSGFRLPDIHIHIR